MRIFGKKESVKPTYDERLATLEELCSKLKREVVSNSMDLDTLRDKVLRKIQHKRKQEDETENSNDSLQEDGFGDIRKLQRVNRETN